MRTLTALFVLLAATSVFGAELLPDALTDQTKECLMCHADANPGLYQQWGASKHYGANVGCYECHLAGEDDIDRLRDGIHDDYAISTIVSPKDCSRCHSKEVDEFLNSHHSKAGRIMGSLDNMLAEVVEGNNGLVTPMFPAGISAAAVNGCWQCHGSVVKVDAETGILDPATWPNSGIGRVNPGRHGGHPARPVTRGIRVLRRRWRANRRTAASAIWGPDHPQYEVYQESKHGIAVQRAPRGDEPRLLEVDRSARTTPQRRPVPPVT